ncbi:DUF4235 domain-containing protein [Brachybacterium sp. DNPG3]
MANPLVKIIVPIVGVAVGTLGRKAATAGWGAVFGEDAPTAKAQKASAKATAKQRKQAKKAGLGKDEIARITDPMQNQAAWKVALWTILSGVVLQAVRQAAQRGATRGTEALISRRPRANRG